MSKPDTPMMRQYQEIKDKHQGFLLFYRMGDFYELFGEDAVIASDILQITLTSRRTAKDGDKGIPMCGVPFHAAEAYIARLLKAGRKVALCDQIETPEEAKKRGGYKALVRREVTRLFTGGTLTEDNLLKADSNNYLAALAESGGELALSWLDLSTGEFFVQSTALQELSADLAQINPQELLIDEKIATEYAATLAPFASKLTIQNPMLDTESAENAINNTFSKEKIILPSRGITRAVGALIDYVTLTQMGQMPALTTPKIQASHLYIDAASLRNLELTQTLSGERKGSLLWAINHTVTPYGTRLLERWLTAPLANLKQLQERQQAIGILGENFGIRGEIILTLKGTADLARALSRITLGRGSPRDLGAISTTLKQLPEFTNLLENIQNQSHLLGQISKNLTGFDELSGFLTSALEVETLPQLARDGGFVRAGFCERLDSHRDLSSNGLQRLQELESKEVERCGISSLKVKYNKVWGYFFEVTKSNLDRVPEHFIHRQTTTNAQRFSTADLMQLERDISAAKQNAQAREMEIFTELTQKINDHASQLLEAASALATLDVLCAGAELAEKQQYTQPKLSDDAAFIIERGRHPVVEKTVENFVANNANLSGGKLWLITGPNMAGKSTFLRQNALIAILAQIGYPVPAQNAEIGLVDKIFTRIGASDDLAAGRSTFMVEMVEAADILNGATPKSLVVLDEIGRGTATYDGLAIAWGCVEHLLTKCCCRGLFATHYHELTSLDEQFPNLENHNVAVKQWKGEVVFLHELKDGAASGSYGVHVAKLAGLPSSVIQRAEDILSGLEKASRGKAAASAGDLPLFTSSPISHVVEPSKVEEHISELNLDDLTPKQAQDMLYTLKSMLK